MTITDPKRMRGRSRYAESRRRIIDLVILLGVAGAISVATVATVVAAANRLDVHIAQPAIALPIVLIAGLIALVVALGVLVGTFAIFGLSNPKASFGLPEGTMQAVIAMMIILIFAVASLYLHASSQTTTVKSIGISEAQLAAIPPDEIRGIVANPDKTNPGVTTYTVERAFENRLADDFAKQLLTTLSTLVVAVAGFYFGAKSVETGARAARDLGPSTREASQTTETPEAAVATLDAETTPTGAVSPDVTEGDAPPDAGTEADRADSAVESPPSPDENA